MRETKTYKLLVWRMHHEGQAGRLPPGSLVKLDAEEAALLLASGAIAKTDGDTSDQQQDTAPAAPEPAAQSTAAPADDESPSVAVNDATGAAAPLSRAQRRAQRRALMGEDGQKSADPAADSES